LKSIFPTEQDSYRNAYIIENKIKTFTGFYTTILSYKKELNSMLFKLREMLKTGGSVEEFKQALKEVLGERSRIQNKTEENKQKIDEILKDKPNLLPKSL
jgi:flagellar hook-basal body complex protein FliE